MVANEDCWCSNLTIESTLIGRERQRERESEIFKKLPIKRISQCDIHTQSIVKYVDCIQIQIKFKQKLVSIFFCFHGV